MKANLQANLNWPQNQNIELPKVSVEITESQNYILVHFDVEEPSDCYIANVHEDGGPCYQDSCVEIFLATDDGAYRNFEFNSLGHCLSAKGKDRYERTTLTAEEYATIERKANMQGQGEKIRWTLDAKIPKALGVTMKGNAYKCGDKANTPHYMSLFPIDMPKADFHRPEFFREIV